jgi:hypothetical protein
MEVAHWVTIIEALERLETHILGIGYRGALGDDEGAFVEDIRTKPVRDALRAVLVEYERAERDRRVCERTRTPYTGEED